MSNRASYKGQCRLWGARGTLFHAWRRSPWGAPWRRRTSSGHGVGGLLRNEMDLERWMAAAKTVPFARVKIERSFETELQGGSGTGMYPEVDADGKMCFVHKYRCRRLR